MDSSLPVADGHLIIDLDALVANFAALSARVAPARCAGVIKADAYGLGVGPVARALARAGCRDFFVAQHHEALLARPHLPDAALLYVLNGLPPGAEAACRDARAIPVLNTLAQARRWSAFAAQAGAPLDAVLQFDSGMSRLGLSLGDALALRDDPTFAAWVRPVLLMSHLACADHHDDPANAAQRDAFERIAAVFPGVPRSLANSGATFLPHGFHFDLARTGIALYGGLPSDAAGAEMRAVVRLRARIVQIRDVAAGTHLGYGYTHVATGAARWATLGVGYADGWPRRLGGVGAAWASDVRLPILGRVSMDSMSVDLSALPPGALAEGDWVDLIGPQQTLDAVAGQAGTISYEILTGLGHRFARDYLGAGA